MRKTNDAKFQNYRPGRAYPSTAHHQADQRRTPRPSWRFQFQRPASWPCRPKCRDQRRVKTTWRRASFHRPGQGESRVGRDCAKSPECRHPRRYREVDGTTSHRSRIGQTMKTTGVSAELSYYRRVTATPAGKARLALIKRTKRRLMKRLKQSGRLRESKQ
jgi:hypothetical protein